MGVAGLLGAGRTELLEALFGASAEPPRGTILLDGEPVRFRRPDQAIAAGVALVTEDRKTLGLFDRMTVAENITLASLGDVTSRGLVSRRAERAAVHQAIADLAIKTAGGRAAITSLSGGNQQKCIIARWLLTNPRLLLLDEPTRGIDVGAKAEIYALIRRLAAGGHGDPDDLERAARAAHRLRPHPRPLRGPAHRRVPACRGDRGGDHARGDAVPRSGDGLIHSVKDPDALNVSP